MQVVDCLSIEGLSGAETLDSNDPDVYRAHQDEFDRDVVVKVLDKTKEPIVPRRFDLKRRTLASFTVDPGVVHVLDSGMVEGRPYLVLPYCPVGSLDDQLAHGPMPWHRATELIRQTAHTVGRAHSLGIALGDIRPSKILLADASTPLVSVFGMATRRSDPLSSVYAAPGRGWGNPTSMADDVYSLSLVLAALIVGKVPVRGPQLIDFLVETATLVPTRIYEVIKSGLSTQTSIAYNSASRLARSLDAAIEDRHNVRSTVSPNDELDIEDLLVGSDSDTDDTAATKEADVEATGDAVDIDLTTADTDVTAEFVLVDLVGSKIDHSPTTSLPPSGQNQAVGPHRGAGRTISTRRQRRIGHDPTTSEPKSTSPETDDPTMPLAALATKVATEAAEAHASGDTKPGVARSKPPIINAPSVAELASTTQELRLSDLVNEAEDFVGVQQTVDTDTDTDRTRPTACALTLAAQSIAGTKNTPTPERSPLPDSEPDGVLAKDVSAVVDDPPKTTMLDTGPIDLPPIDDPVPPAEKTSAVKNPTDDDVLIDTAEAFNQAAAIAVHPHGPQPYDPLKPESLIPAPRFASPVGSIDPPGPQQQQRRKGRTAELIDVSQHVLFNQPRSFATAVSVVGIAAVAILVGLLVVRELEPEPGLTTPPTSGLAAPTATQPSLELSGPATANTTPRLDDRVDPPDVQPTTGTTEERPTTVKEEMTEPAPEESSTTKPPETTIAPTTNPAPTTTPPNANLIRQATASRIRDRQARVSFNSSECVTATFSYAKVGGPELGSVSSQGKCSPAHVLLLGQLTDELTPGTEYNVTITATNPDGESATETVELKTLG